VDAPQPEGVMSVTNCVTGRDSFDDVTQIAVLEMEYKKGNGGSIFSLFPYPQLSQRWLSPLQTFARCVFPYQPS